jgi:bifunctional DNA-binding transcriptional regulator/antitoxin component of YhaV-PrlF toxin-antitoxin module
VLFSLSQHPIHARAGVVALDRRWRILLPYGIRVQIGWEPAVRLMVLVAPIDGFVAALPVTRIAAALLGNP